MFALLIASILAIVAGVGSLFVDQRVLRCGSAWRFWPAAVLVVVSVWIAVIIPTSMFLKTPGAYGPVQFWIDDSAADWFMMGPRLWSMFMMYASALILAPVTILTAVLSLFFHSNTNRWYRLVIPFIAILGFVLAFFLSNHYQFYPRA